MSTTTTTTSTTKRRRGLWIVGLLAMALGLAWPAAWLLQCREALRLRLKIEKLSGRVEVASPGPAWLSWLVDPRYFERVVAIHLANVQRIDDGFFNSFPDLETLAFFNVPLREQDLAQLGSLERLHTLSLMRTLLEGPELAHLAEVRGLTELRLGWARDEMVPYLAGCDNLQILVILNSGQITDQGLERFPALPQLRQVRLVSTATTSRGVQALQERCPAAEIFSVDSLER